MRKTVQIVTIPYDGESDLLQVTTDAMEYRGIMKGSIGLHSIPNVLDENYQAMQLLVVSDDEIQDDDFILFNNMVWKVLDKKQWQLDTWETAKKIVASYPHIDGTCSTFRQCVIDWAMANFPKEATITDNHGDLLLFWCKNTQEDFKPLTTKEIEDKAANEYPPLIDCFAPITVADLREAYVKGYHASMIDLGRVNANLNDK